MISRYNLAIFVVAATASLLLAVGVVILISTDAQNQLGDALCITAAILGITWSALAAARRRRGH